MQEIVRRIHARYKQVRWMKLAEIARYWAAIEAIPGGLRLSAPYDCADFTLRWRASTAPRGLRKVRGWESIEPGTWRRDGEHVVACISLKKGVSELV